MIVESGTVLKDQQVIAVAFFALETVMLINYYKTGAVRQGFE